MPRAVPLSRGAFTVSIDVEILWGVWDLAPSRGERRLAALERTITRRLLNLFRAHEIRATWAVVGRLLDDRHGFDGLRGSRDCWYAPDVVEAIRRSEIEHEIGSHSYAHVYFDQISSEAARADLRRAAAVHRAHGLSFASFVFPRNGVAHLDAVKDAGLEVFRSTDAGLMRWVDGAAPRLRPLVNLADKALALPSPVVHPLVHDNGLVELPSSMLLMARGGLRRVIHPRALEQKIVAGLKRASRDRGLFHLWFHPSNFYSHLEAQLAVLDRALEAAASLRDRGELEVKTMGDFSALAS